MYFNKVFEIYILNKSSTFSFKIILKRCKLWLFIVIIVRRKRNDYPRCAMHTKGLSTTALKHSGY
jgi:hypothetical protein